MCADALRIIIIVLCEIFTHQLCFYVEWCVYVCTVYVCTYTVHTLCTYTVHNFNVCLLVEWKNLISWSNPVF